MSGRRGLFAALLALVLPARRAEAWVIVSGASQPVRWYGRADEAPWVADDGAAAGGD